MNVTRSTAAAVMILGAVGVGPALADTSEIIAIYNSAENDSNFAMLSYRGALGGTLDSGLLGRIDISRGVFDVTGSEGTIDTVRLLLGYRIDLGNTTNITLYGGPSWRERDYSVLLPGLTEFDEVGAFVSAEYNADFGGGEVFALAEYDTTQNLFYTSAFYQADFGTVKIGPTANYLSEGNYERRAFGLRVTIPISADVDISATGAWAEGDTGGPAIDSNYFELQFRTRF